MSDEEREIAFDMDEDSAGAEVAVESADNHLDSAQVEIPERLPVLPLKNTVLFPFLLSPLLVRSEPSKQLIDEVLLSPGRLLLCVAVNKETQLAPGPTDVQRVGTVVRIAKMLNRLWHRTGRVFVDRYFMRVMTSAMEVWRLLRYVLHNGRKHGQVYKTVDPYSSGWWFKGWSGSIDCPAATVFAGIERPTAEARSALLRDEWLIARPIYVHERPAVREVFS